MTQNRHFMERRLQSVFWSHPEGLIFNWVAYICKFRNTSLYSD